MDYTPWDCPQCGTKYKLPLGKKPPRRCKKCADWEHFEAEVTAAEEAVAIPVEPEPPPEPTPKTFEVVAVEKPKSTWRPRRRLPRWTWAAFIGLGAALTFGLLQLRASLSTPPRHDLIKDMTSEEQKVLRAELFASAQATMLKHLKSPKSATFEAEHDIEIRPDLFSADKIEALVKGHVESQNALGVFLRSPFLVRLKGSTLDRKWTSRAVMLGDDVLDIEPALMQEILASQKKEPEPPKVAKWKRIMRYHFAAPKSTPYVEISTKVWKVQYTSHEDFTLTTQLEGGERNILNTPGRDGEIQFENGPCSCRFIVSSEYPWTIYIYEAAE